MKKIKMAALLALVAGPAAAQPWTAVIRVVNPVTSERGSFVLPGFSTSEACLAASKSVAIEAVGPLSVEVERDYAAAPQDRWVKSRLPRARIACLDDAGGAPVIFEELMVPQAAPPAPAPAPSAPPADRAPDKKQKAPWE